MLNFLPLCEILATVLVRLENLMLNEKDGQNINSLPCIHKQDSAAWQAVVEMKLLNIITLRRWFLQDIYSIYEVPGAVNHSISNLASKFSALTT
jgi:hypothetical protein